MNKRSLAGMETTGIEPSWTRGIESKEVSSQRMDDPGFRAEVNHSTRRSPRYYSLRRDITPGILICFLCVRVDYCIL